MHELVIDLWRTRRMTVFMATHDIGEAFKLGTRVLTFDKVRIDPHEPHAFGATITYDLAGLDRANPQQEDVPCAPAPTPDQAVPAPP
jgi:NitT/TauT family transport system ATP-binding protein